MKLGSFSYKLTHLFKFC